MKVLRVIRIETAPGGTVHLVTDGGDHVSVTRRANGYSAAQHDRLRRDFARFSYASAVY
jgi:predicted chitinase